MPRGWASFSYDSKSNLTPKTTKTQTAKKLGFSKGHEGGSLRQLRDYFQPEKGAQSEEKKMSNPQGNSKWRERNRGPESDLIRLNQDTALVVSRQSADEAKL